MNKTTNRTVYRYALTKEGKLHISQGVMTEDRAIKKGLTIFEFEGKHSYHPEEFGKVLVNKARVLLLHERNDELAIRLFKEWAERRIEQLKQDVDKTLKIIDSLEVY